jgi:signal transduction histidine kinase
VGGAVIVAALAVMALVTVMGLTHADRLLHRLSNSQEQLAQVTQLQADINGLLADVALKTTSDRGLALAIKGIESRMGDYRRSISAEDRWLGPGAGVAAHQAAEVRTADAMKREFSRLGADLLQANSSTAATSDVRVAADRDSFGATADEVVAGERREAREALDAMRRLRDRLGALAAGILLSAGLGCAVGAWLMLAGVVRPLRLLEGAAERAGRGDSPSVADVGGFTEFRHFARAFDRMDAQITAQHAALRGANRDLEAKVRERTHEIEASRETLAQVDRTRRLFFSKVSHELRTPVTVIRGEAEVALRDGVASAARLRDALEHVVANGAFLQRRLDDMLALARVEDGRLMLRREPVDLAAVARAVVALAEPYVRSCGMALRADIPDRSGLTITGDASWLAQALLALIDNAAKFAIGGEAISLILRTTPSSALITVVDQGPGVAAADLPLLFESYHQAAEGPSRGGSGLGLTVARWVVEQHGGVIVASNAPERGLAIEITLPVGG